MQTFRKDWRGKKAVIQWSDGSVSEFPAKSEEHYILLQCLVHEKRIPVAVVAKLRAKA